MKSVLVWCWMVWFSMSITAQDFASRFLAEHTKDSNFICVTISPKMMEEILKNDDQRKDEEVLEVISNLKSMQMLTSKVNGKHYYAEALEVVEQNGNRFESVLSHTSLGGNYQILIRKRREQIVEMVMLTNKKDEFTVINFTGNMNVEFIDKLTDSVKWRNE